MITLAVHSPMSMHPIFTGKFRLFGGTIFAQLQVMHQSWVPQKSWASKNWASLSKFSYIFCEKNVRRVTYKDINVL